jgi:hypothetical protein
MAAAHGGDGSSSEMSGGDESGGDRSGENGSGGGQVGQKWVGWGRVGQERVSREKVAVDPPSFNWFQNGLKSRRLFTYTKHKQMINSTTKNLRIVY